MKVFFLSSQKYYYGGEKQAIHLAKSLISLGVQCTISAPSNTPFAEEIIGNNINFIPYPTIENLVSFIKNVRRYTIVHTLDSQALNLALLIKPIIRKSLLHSRRVSYKINGLFSILKYRMADKIVVLTNYYRNYLNKLGITRISVIPDMITPKPLNTIRATTLVEKFKLKNSFIVGVIARFDPAKAPFVLLNACAKLKKEGINFKVLHFGDGELRDKIEQFIKENNLENNYLLMGYLKDPEDFYSIFNCFVLPSIQEGMPNSILNAFYYKVPVIASDIPTIKEFAYGKAILFPSGNPDALSEAIKSVIENKINTKNLIENAFNYVSTYHSPTKIASLYLREYEQLLHKYNL